MSARDRRSRNLAESTGNQFSRYRATSQDAATAPVWRRRGQKDQDASFEQRRRTERNYSDLFGNQQTSPKKVTNREEVIGTATCDFLNPHAEIAHRNTTRWRPSGNMSPREARDAQATSEVLPQSAKKVVPLSSEEQMVSIQERACWDTRGFFESDAEIARRHRERAAPTKMSGPRAQSASETKRLHLASGQFRKSTGVDPVPWDDGRAGPPPPATDRSVITQTSMSSPRPTLRNPATHSARQRKLASLMSSAF